MSLHSPTSLETKHLQEQARAEQADRLPEPLFTGPVICIPAEFRPSFEAESGMVPSQGGTHCSGLAASSTGSPGWKSQPSVQPGPVLWTSLTWLDSPVLQLPRPGLQCSGPNPLLPASTTLPLDDFGSQSHLCARDGESWFYGSRRCLGTAFQETVTGARKRICICLFL